MIGQERFDLLIVGGGQAALKQLRSLHKPFTLKSLTVVSPVISPAIRAYAETHSNILIHERNFHHDDLADKNLVIAASDDVELNEKIRDQASGQRILVHSVSFLAKSDFFLPPEGFVISGGKISGKEERKWKSVATYSIIAFGLMIIGHLVISLLPIPSFRELTQLARPYFNNQFLFFVLAGFAAQMVDGALSMGYGVVSATCLMSFGVSPVASSAAIHTSEIFTTGISGYSHYKFGNVNKRLFRHLLIPGVLGAIGGAILLVVLGEKAGKWLMPLVALYAMFLGLKIIFKAIQIKKASGKVKRIGWLAGTGGFLDSFGGGGWGPIVTSTLVSKGRDPKYTIGSVCLTEFFVTMASALTFFLTVGIQHWNIVLGLIIGGSIAAPLAVRLAGKLPRKTMMIAVGIMVIIWCIRMFLKSIGVL